MDAQPAVLRAVNSGVDSCEPLHKVGRELRAGWSHTNPGEEEHEHFAALWAAMEFRVQDGTWDVVLGPFRSTDDNGDLVPRAVKDMAPAVLDAWAAYAPETTHPLVRARLNHLLWVARHGTRPIEHLRSAVRSYRDAASALLTKVEEHLEALVPPPELGGAASFEVEVARLAAADALVLAYGLAAATRQPERTDIVGEMIALGQAALAWKPPSPGVLGLMTAPLVVSTHDKPAVRPLLERAVDEYCGGGQLHYRVEFLEELRCVVGADEHRDVDEQIHHARMELADSSTGFRKLLALEDAARHARDSGLTNALDEVRRTQQKIGRDELPMDTIGTPVPLPAGYLEAASAAIDAADRMEHALHFIATTPPTMSDSATPPSGLLSLPMVYINPNGPVVTRTVGSDSTGGEGFFFRQHVFTLDVHGLVVETQLDRVRDRFRPTAEDLVPFFASPEHAPETRIRGLARAFEAFWEGDADTALALALPRLEGTLRRRLQAADIAMITHAKGETIGQVQQLGSLLDKLDELGFPEPWPLVLRTVLGNAEGQMNLRNNVLHDLVDTPSRHRAALVLQIALAVLFLGEEPPARTASADSGTRMPLPWNAAADQRLPFPVPDTRAHHFVTQYADMHDVVAGLAVPSGIPQPAATVLHTSRELLRHSYFCYEFSTVALLHALIAMEIVLRAKIPDSGTKPLRALIKQGKESGLLTERQTEFLHEGRKLRNRIAHGQRAHSVMPPRWGAGMLTTSFTLIGEVWAAQPTPRATTDTDEGTGI
ncbi:DUF7380 domain-containing protein [Streptomyces drozdowiczii]|uniref:DUF7380 domain-containing protein n=1 Tax=Streptomyces drozdowiczii TaxID=202862 RepID=A0ABY6PKC6_9ACTN|nr:hypothetical protein [Streptomyces drozdowiczii]MCX0247893.1 hypothetical protein [Streptomyces drozdowiczii]UZK52749.1 hypothetical protein NEH16_00250 [Streptomyces drozdowiczii]